MISPFYDQRNFHKTRSIKGAVKLICTIVMLRGGSRISVGGANMDIYIRGKRVDITSVQSTLSMWSMLYLGGSGGMPPQENFANLAY